MIDGAVLAARSVVRRFGTFTALDRVDFSVGEGEIVALLGENGAGKSTLMNLLSGMLAPTEGSILLDGKVVRFSSPTDAAARGIGMVHQHFLLVPTLTVAENLLLSANRSAGGPFSYPLRIVLKEAQILAGRLGWTIPWDRLAGSLPVGTQQRVEILKALRGQTRVLILDEPTAVLTPTETPELFATIRRLADEGRGIVFISHKLDEVMALSERVLVLRRGKLVFSRMTADVDEKMLAEAMVGKDSEAASLLTAANETSADSDPENTDSVEAGFQVKNITIRSPKNERLILDDISFAVQPGEIFGVAGVDGNGQEELAEVLSGLRRPSIGTIQIGTTEPPFAPAAFRLAGVATIPADRQTRGLAMPMSITENVAFGVYDDPKYRRGPILLWDSLRQHAEMLQKRFDIRSNGVQTPVSDLSGGNQQKVVIARALASNPKVLIAVNPTRGLDVGAIAYVHGALRKAQADGAAIVLISTELNEIMLLATRSIAVLYEGRFTGIVAANAPREQIGLLMGGKTSERRRR